MQKLIEKVKILIEAMPYIQTFRDKTFVIKYGGSAMSHESLKRESRRTWSCCGISASTR